MNKIRDEMEYFDKFSKAYDNFSRDLETLKSYERALEEISVHLPADKILEIGCGIGWIAERVISDCKMFVGNDISVKSVKICHEKVPNATFIVFDATKQFPFLDETFDIVFCANVLHHLKGIVGDFNLTISEMYRVLRQGGLLVISKEPNMFNIGNEVYSFLRRIRIGFRDTPTSPHEKGTISRMELKNAFLGAHITDYSISEFGFFPVVLESIIRRKSHLSAVFRKVEKQLERSPIRFFGVDIKAKTIKSGNDKK